MKLTTSTFLQVLALVVQGLNLTLPVVPQKYKVYVMTGIGILQLVLHNMAGNSNPDGTPAVTK